MAARNCNHAIINLHCPHCLALFQEWNIRLKAAGFVEIEDQTLPSDPPLIDWHSTMFCTPQQRIKQQIYEHYYEQASNLLLTYQFKKPIHRKIWEFHCAGLSRREIAVKLEGTRKPLKHAAVGNIIKAIAKGIK